MKLRQPFYSPYFQNILGFIPFICPFFGQFLNLKGKRHICDCSIKKNIVIFFQGVSKSHSFMKGCIIIFLIDSNLCLKEPSPNRNQTADLFLPPTLWQRQEQKTMCQVA